MRHNLKKQDSGLD